MRPACPGQLSGNVAGCSCVYRPCEAAESPTCRCTENILKLDPESVLKSGEHPGPLAEVEFWKAKSRHLNSIQLQLQGEKVRKVRVPLRATLYYGTMCSSDYFRRPCAGDQGA